ncbi:MAG: glycosyltransferase, partial [Nitrososphaera sp.]|nr:glycosyltransferase [Nitrososphaera sp.]
MKLILTGRLAWKNDEFLRLLQTYNYKEDVVLTGYLEEAELANVMADAYALVYPSLFEGFGVPVLEALQCRVPVLTSAHSAMQEISNTAALYFDAADPASMADQLMLIYKDEDLRRTLIEKGRSVAKKYSWQRTAELMWACIEKAGK